MLVVHALPKAAGNPADVVRNVPGQHTETGSLVKCQGGMETQGRAWRPESLSQPLSVGSGGFPEVRAVISAAENGREEREAESLGLRA